MLFARGYPVQFHKKLGLCPRRRRRVFTDYAGVKFKYIDINNVQFVLRQICIKIGVGTVAVIHYLGNIYNIAIRVLIKGYVFWFQ